MSVGCPIRASFVYPFFHFTEIIVTLFHPYNFIWSRLSHREGILESSFGLAFITTKEVEPVLPSVHVWNIQWCLLFFANLLNISHLFEYGFLKKPLSLDSFERSRFPTLNLVIINVFLPFWQILDLKFRQSVCFSLSLCFSFFKTCISLNFTIPFTYLQGPRIVAVFWPFLKSLCLRTQQPDHGKLRLLYWLNTHTHCTWLKL